MTCLRSGDPAGSLTDYYPSWLDIRFQWRRTSSTGPELDARTRITLQAPAKQPHRRRHMARDHELRTQRIKRLESEGGRQSLNKIFHRSGPPQHVGRRAMDQAEQGDPQLRIPRLHGWVA
jgi:hypothetical protein